MAGPFFPPRCLRPRNDGTSATMVPGVGTRANREGDSDHPEARADSPQIVRGQELLPEIICFACWLRRFERAVLCYHESPLSPPRPPVLPPCVMALSFRTTL